jgi:hypothetical protein
LPPHNERDACNDQDDFDSIDGADDGDIKLFTLSMIFPDLPSLAEAGFAKVENRFPLFGIML